MFYRLISLLLNMILILRLLPNDHGSAMIWNCISNWTEVRCPQEHWINSLCQLLTLQKTSAGLCGQCNWILTSRQFERMNAGFTCRPPTPYFFLLAPENPLLLLLLLLCSPPSLHSLFLFVSEWVILWCRVERSLVKRAAQDSCCWTLTIISQLHCPNSSRFPQFKLFLRCFSHPHPFLFLFSYTTSSPPPPQH